MVQTDLWLAVDGLPEHIRNGEVAEGRVLAFNGIYVGKTRQEADQALDALPHNVFQTAFYRNIAGSYYLYTADTTGRDRLAYGTKTEKWCLVDATDRDYGSAIPLHTFVNKEGL